MKTCVICDKKDIQPATPEGRPACKGFCLWVLSHYARFVPGKKIKVKVIHDMKLLKKKYETFLETRRARRNTPQEKTSRSLF